MSDQFFSLGLDAFAETPQEGEVFSGNELAVSAQGGTELMQVMLRKYVDPDLLDQVYIIPSRVRTLHPTKPNVLWLHDLWDDPENAHLARPDSRARFAKLVFASHTQFGGFHERLGVPYQQSQVLRNAIEPIDDHEKPKDRVNLIYHTTPHRGLEILVPVFQKLYEMFGDQIHLDVYSSFNAYGWPGRDEPYEPLFEICRQHPGITYHGFRPNAEVRQALQRAHIFAYPSIWRETSCIAALEAISAQCTVVCSSFGALPETCGPFSAMYPYSEDMREHANRFAGTLHQMIEIYLQAPELNTQMTRYAKQFVDLFYGWEVRKREWDLFLKGLIAPPAN